MILPTDTTQNMAAQKVAAAFRAGGITVAVDLSDRKLAKKMSAASDALASFVLVLGDDESASGTYRVKNLADGSELSGTIDELRSQLT